MIERAETPELIPTDKEVEWIYEQVRSPRELGIVLQPSASAGSFDSMMVDNPHVFQQNGMFYMTYVGFDGEGYRTGLAASRDLVEWEKLGVIAAPGNTEGDWDRCNAAGYLVRNHTWGMVPTAHEHNGKLYMPYLASSDPGYEQGITVTGLSIAERLEGPWHNVPRPIMSPEVWEYEKQKIWKYHVIPLNNRFYAFYNAGWGPEVMCIAESHNMLHWRRYQDNPVLKASIDLQGRAWGKEINGDADVVRIGDCWVMFYFSDSPYGVIDTYAVSKDMFHWRKSHIALRHCNETYSKDAAHKPNVFKHAGLVYHFYTAVGSEGRVIALAVSDL